MVVAFVQTLFLTVHLIDRYLQAKAVKRQKLQLVGVTAMLIASKYEEIYAPEIRDFVYISDNAYTSREIVKFENTMLSTLDYRISTPSILSFLNRFIKIVGKEQKSTVALLARYYVESMLQEYSMLRYPASIVAASSLALARKTLGKKRPWVSSKLNTTSMLLIIAVIVMQNENLRRLGQYTEQDLKPCMVEIADLMKPENGSGKKSHLKAVKNKWSQESFSRVACFKLPICL